MRKGLLCAIALVFGLGAVGMIADQAQARPKYLGAFIEKYPKVAAEAGKVKCGVCHPETDKKVRNDYAMAVGKGLPEKNAKENDVIFKAFDGAAKVKNADGKAYGDLIEDGKLPN
jgi:hypothetical protein